MANVSDFFLPLNDKNGDCMCNQMCGVKGLIEPPFIIIFKKRKSRPIKSYIMADRNPGGDFLTYFWNGAKHENIFMKERNLFRDFFMLYSVIIIWQIYLLMMFINTISAILSIVFLPQRCLRHKKNPVPTWKRDFCNEEIFICLRFRQQFL